MVENGPPVRIDTCAPALFAGFIAFAIDPREEVLLGWTFGVWLCLTAIVVVALILEARRLRKDSVLEGASHRHDHLVEAWIGKAQLLRAAGRTEETLTAYDEVIRYASSHASRGMAAAE